MKAEEAFPVVRWRCVRSLTASDRRFSASHELQPNEAEYQRCLRWDFAAPPNKVAVASATKGACQKGQRIAELVTARFLPGGARSNARCSSRKRSAHHFQEVLRVKLTTRSVERSPRARVPPG